jgi:hypothetical protein
VIPYILTPAELDGLLRVGEALTNISERLSAMMGRNGGPLAGELADLAALTIDLLDVVEKDPDLEGGGDEEPSLGWLHDSRSASGNDNHDLDCEEDIADRLHDAEPDEASRQLVRLDAALNGEAAVLLSAVGCGWREGF